MPYLEKIPSIKNFFLTKIWYFVKIVFFFHLVCIGWLIFRAQSLTQIFNMLYGMIMDFSIQSFDMSMFRQFITFVWLLFIIQVFQLNIFIKFNNLDNQL